MCLTNCSVPFWGTEYSTFPAFRFTKPTVPYFKTTGQIEAYLSPLILNSCIYLVKIHTSILHLIPSVLVVFSVFSRAATPFIFSPLARRRSFPKGLKQTTYYSVLQFSLKTTSGVAAGWCLLERTPSGAGRCGGIPFTAFTDCCSWLPEGSDDSSVVFSYVNKGN